MAAFAAGLQLIETNSEPPLQFEKDEKKIGRTIWGLVGLGAFGYNALTDRATAKNATSNISQNLIITTTKSHRSEQLDSTLEKLKPSKIIRAGGAGYKALLVLEGDADSYFYPSAGCKVRIPGANLMRSSLP